MSGLAGRAMWRRGPQCGADPRGDLGRHIGCGAVVRAEIAEVTADTVKGRQHFGRVGVGAYPLAQCRRRVIIEQARLEVGELVECDRFVARVAVHRCPRPSCHALTQASLHHAGLDGREAVTVPCPAWRPR